MKDKETIRAAIKSFLEWESKEVFFCTLDEKITLWEEETKDYLETLIGGN